MHGGKGYFVEARLKALKRFHKYSSAGFYISSLPVAPEPRATFLYRYLHQHKSDSFAEFFLRVWALFVAEHPSVVTLFQSLELVIELPLKGLLLVDFSGFAVNLWRGHLGSERRIRACAPP